MSEIKMLETTNENSFQHGPYYVPHYTLVTHKKLEHYFSFIRKILNLLKRGYIIEYIWSL